EACSPAPLPPPSRRDPPNRGGTREADGRHAEGDPRPARGVPLAPEADDRVAGLSGDLGREPPRPLPQVRRGPPAQARDRARPRGGDRALPGDGEPLPGRRLRGRRGGDPRPARARPLPRLVARALRRPVPLRPGREVPPPGVPRLLLPPLREGGDA